MELTKYTPVAEKVLQKADGVMILVSGETSTDPFALWEIEYSLSNSIPTVGVDIRPMPEGPVPANLDDRMIKFGWEWFAEFFNTL